MNIEQYINEPLEIQGELLKYFDKEKEITIFDIGACEAEDSIKYSNIFPNSKIYSFEPFVDNYKKGLSNIEKYNKKNVNLFNEALSDKIGESIFYLSSGHPKYVNNSEEWNYGNKSSSLIEPNPHEWLMFKNSVAVKTNTIFNFCQEHSINSINFAHMDVQGAELMVLNGALSMIENMDIIWLEVSLVEFYKSQPLKNTVYKFLQDNNFTIVKDTCISVAGDLLCINNKIIKK